MESWVELKDRAFLDSWIERRSFLRRFLLGWGIFGEPLSIASALRLSVEFQWFLIALSVRPGNNLAILAHWLPYVRCAWMIALSSSSVQEDLLICGLRWLCHLSRHCLPIRPLSSRAIKVHFLGPYFLTSLMTIKNGIWLLN